MRLLPPTLLSIALTAAGLAAPAHAADAKPGMAAASVTGRLAARTPLATKAGTTLAGARDWTVRREGALLLLDPPEADTRVVVADVRAADAKAAAAAVWAMARPVAAKADMPLVHTITPEAAREGWDERATISYDTPPAARRFVEAELARKGDLWNVILVDASEQTAEKRESAIQLAKDSVRPAGYRREDVSRNAPRRLTAARIAELRDFLAQSMKALGIPGAGFALIDGGKIVHEGGIGVRELGKPEKVDADTLFMAASNTKGMTTLLLSTLADQGRLRWDQPVVELYPTFRLGSDDVTRRVEVKHLVCACTGLPRQDMEWMFEYRDATPDTSFTLLAQNMPTSGFGEVYQYNNLMAAAAGYVAAHLIHPDMPLGAAYDRAMQERIFGPLGMTRTTFDMRRALATNHASPHAHDLDNRVVPIPMDFNYSVIPHRPAGGAWTSAHDLIRYVQLEANRGKLPNGKQLVSEKNLLVRRAPGVSTGEDSDYGMGLETTRIAGVETIDHGGSMDGYKSDIYLIPAAGVGAVLLTNDDDGRPILHPFMRKLVEVVYGAKPQALDEVKAAAARVAAERAREKALLTLPADPARVAALAPLYRSPALGELAVRRQGGQTVFDFGEWKTEVASRAEQDGSVSFEAVSPGLVSYMRIEPGEREGKRVLIVRDGQHEYVFTEAAG